MFTLTGCEPEEDVYVFRGMAVVAEPLIGGEVSIWSLEGDDWGPETRGVLVGRGRIGEEVSLEFGPPGELSVGMAGYFEIPVTVPKGDFKIVVTGGQMSEFWSDNLVPMDSSYSTEAEVPEVPLVSYVLDGIASEKQIYTVSPFTTIASSLAASRFVNQNNGRREFRKVIRDSYGAFNSFLSTDIVLRFPEWGGVRIEYAAYALALAGLSTQAYEIARKGFTKESFNTMSLVRALVEDASDSAAVLDGIGLEGSVEVGQCLFYPCYLDPETLRIGIVRAILDVYRYEPEGMEWRFNFVQLLPKVIPPRSPAQLLLFGDREVSAPFDADLPILDIVDTLIRDEISDAVTFHPDSFEPQHSSEQSGNDSQIWNTKDAFYAASCPVVYKHVNILHDRPSGNPIKWIIRERDRTGIIYDIEYRVGYLSPLSSSLGCPSSIRIDDVEWLLGGQWRYAESGVRDSDTDDMDDTDLYSIWLTRDNVPELVDRDGIFVIQVRTTDWIGNRSETLTGRWRNIPLPPPLLLHGTTLPVGGNALHTLSLNDNRLLDLVEANTISVDKAPVLSESTIENGSSDPAYLDLFIDHKTATQIETRWTSWGALQRREEFDPPLVCKKDAGCRVDSFDPRQDTLFEQVSFSFNDWGLAIRVLDENRNVMEPLLCPKCQNRYLIEGFQRYVIQLIATNWEHIMPMPIEPIIVHDVYQPFALLGQERGQWRLCTDFDFFAYVCHVMEDFQFYSAVTKIEFHNETQLQVRVSSTPDGTSYIPVATSKLGVPYTLVTDELPMSVSWDTEKTVLPITDLF